MRRASLVAASVLSLTAFAVGSAVPAQGVPEQAVSTMSEQVSELLTGRSEVAANTNAQAPQSLPGIAPEAPAMPVEPAAANFAVTVAAWPAGPVLQSNGQYPVSVKVTSGGSAAAGVKVGFQFSADGGEWMDVGLPLGGPATFTPGKDIPEPTRIATTPVTNANGDAIGTVVAPTAASPNVVFRAVVLGAPSTPASSGTYAVTIDSNSIYNPPAYSSDPQGQPNTMPTRPGVLIKAQKLDPNGAELIDRPLQYPGIPAANPFDPAQPLAVPLVSGAGAPPCFYRQTTSDPCVIGSTDGSGKTLDPSMFADQYRILYSDQRFIPNPPPFTDERSLGSDQAILEAASALVIVPKNATAESRVVAWDHPTLGQADQCSVSRGFNLIETPLVGSKAPGGAQINAGDMSFFLEQSLAAGNIVVMPDYMGIAVNGPTKFKKSYLIGQQEARDTFYAVKALQAPAGAVPGWDGVGGGKETWTGTDFVAVGHSQGGHAAMWTAIEGQKPWAQALGLHLKGVVAAAPATDVNKIVAEQWEGYPGWVLGPELIQTYVSISPQLLQFGLANNVVTPEGMAALPRYSELCTTQAFADSTQFVTKGINFLKDPAQNAAAYMNWAPLFAQQTPIPTADPSAPMQNSFPRDMPLLLISGTADNIVVSQANAAMQQAFCLIDEGGKPMVPFRAFWSPSMTGLNTPAASSFKAKIQADILNVTQMTAGPGADYTRTLRSLAPANATQAVQNTNKLAIGDTLLGWGNAPSTNAPPNTTVVAIDYDNQLVTLSNPITPDNATLYFKPKVAGPLSPGTEINWVVGGTVYSTTIAQRGTGQGGVGTYILNGAPQNPAAVDDSFQVMASVTPPGGASPVSNQQVPDHLNPLTFPFTQTEAAPQGRAVAYRVEKQGSANVVVLSFVDPLSPEFQPDTQVNISGMPKLKAGLVAIDPNGHQKLIAVDAANRTVTFNPGTAVNKPAVVGTTPLNPPATVSTEPTYHNSASELLRFTEDAFAGNPIAADCHEVDEMRPTGVPGSDKSEGMTWYNFPAFGLLDLVNYKQLPTEEKFYKSWGSGGLPPPTNANAQPSLGLLFLPANINIGTITNLAQDACAFTWKPISKYQARPANPDCVQFGLWPYGKFIYAAASEATGSWGLYPNDGQNANIPAGPGAGATVFVPLDPVRVCDTRLACPGAPAGPVPGSQGSIVFDVDKEINIDTGEIVRTDVVPAEATAIAYNITAVDTSSRGWFAVIPPAESTPQVSTVNWPGAGQVIANGLTVKTGPERQTKVINSSAAPTEMVFDIVGYFIDPAKSAEPGQLFHQINPMRAYDSRIAGPGGTPLPIPGEQGSRVIDVGDMLPPDAKSIAYNIIAVDTSARGWFSVTPGDAETFQASTINWATGGQVIDNGQFVALAGDGTIKVFNGSTEPTNLIIDVLGYFTDEDTSFSGDYYHPINPVRAYDSRAPQPLFGPLGAKQARDVSVADGRDRNTGAVTVPNVVPPGARSINYNVTAVDTTSRGWFEVAPAGSAQTMTSSINWPGANDVIANGLTVGISDGRAIRVRSGATGPTNFTVDLFGYFR